MSTNYPGDLDSYSAKTDGVDIVRAAHINDLQDAIVAIETAIGAPPSPVKANGFLNPDFDIWQRGTSFAAAATNTYSADRWKYVKNGAVVHTLSRSTDVPTPAQAGRQLNYSLLATVTTADAAVAAGDYCLIRQIIEGYNYRSLLAQREFTISFWVKSSVEGVYCLGLQNGAADYLYIAEYTIDAANTWEFKTLTIPAHTGAGTWDYTNGAGLVVSWPLMAGSSHQATPGEWKASGNAFATANQVNAVASNGATFRLAACGITPGQSPITTNPIDFATELARCQRYYEKSYAYTNAPGTNTTLNCEQNTAGNAVSASVAGFIRNCFSNFQVIKRAGPTMVVYAADGTANAISNVTGGGNRTGATASLQAEKRMPQIGLDGTSAVAINAGDIIRWQYTADAEL